MKFLIPTFVLAFSFSIVSPLFAQTYGYIDQNGDLRVVEAENPTLAINTAENIAYDSGVMLMSAKGLALIQELGITIQATVGAVEYTSLKN